jgi:hypothetical protein
MRTTISQIFCVFMALILSACNLPVTATAEIPVQTEPPAASATVISTATQTKAVLTETPSTTATETPLPEASATSTPEAPKAEVVRETNCRTGPAGNYDLVATYPLGQLLEVIAKDLGAGYWFVRNPEKPDEQCYLLAQNIRITGDTSALPKFTPLASPTSMPYFKVDFKKFDTCKAMDFAIFVVENTGSIPFRSAYIKVTDLKVNQSVEQAINAFDLHVGCTLAKNIAPLNPGETGYVESPPFDWNPRGHKLRATFMLCTEQNLKKTCVTQTIEVKP